MGVKGYAIHLSFSPGNAVLNAYKPPKSTRTQGGDPIADYIRADTRLPAYLPYPRFLLKMEISQTAKLLYSLLLDRSTLSQKNKWLDDEGRIYIIYPIAEIAEILDKGSTTIKGALNELDTAGLLERERGGFSAPNRLYVKVPPVPQVQFSDQLMAGSPPLIEPENRPTDGQKTDLMMVGKPSPNQTTINNLTESQTKGVSGGPSAPYGRYGNIFLSQTEYDELQAEYPDRLERFIEEMSRYLAANGKSYQNYAAALRIWAGNDKKEAPKKGHTRLLMQGGREFMKNEINAVLENMTTTIPEPEDYTGEDGLLYCGKCRKPKEAYFTPDKAAIFGRDRHPAECDCQRTAREEREAAEKRRRHLDTVEELKRRGFTDPTMRDWTFENDNGRNPQTGLARRYVEHWEDMRTDNIGCLFWGGVGTGKSYLAGCIANALMEKEIPVRMTNFALILNDLAASFEGRNEYISRLCRYPLLILDDFGMERGTEYGLEQVFNVIDSRYRSGKPLIVTTNLTLDDLHNPEDTAHSRIYDRLLSMCVPVRFTGDNFRQEAAQRKMESMKKLITD